MTEVLIKFSHGLGDVVQLTVVLKHLKKYRPDWLVDVRVGFGKHTALKGLCRRAYHDKEAEPDHSRHKSINDLNWPENYNGYNDRPNSKITNTLHEIFGLDWDKELAQYEIQVGELAFAKARGWLQKIGAIEKDGKFNAVLFHYNGNTSPVRKNLGNWQIEFLINQCFAAHRIPVILDWDGRSPLIDQKRVFNPAPGVDDIWGGFGSGDAETLAALIRLSEAFVGIDSGPGKVASSTETPTLICWTGHHPIQFHDPAPNTTHLIPDRHLDMGPIKDKPDLQRFFNEHYRYTTYGHDSDLVSKAEEWLMGTLGEKVVHTKAATTYLLPSGIGDCMWALLKIRNIARDNPINIALSGDPKREIDNRCVPFLKRFPFINSVRVADVPILVDREHPNDDQGRYRYREGIQGGWQFLAPNGPLERGQRIEEWLPDIPIDYDVINTFSWKDTERGTREASVFEPFVAFYLGPESGHTDEGHNWGWLWEPKHWVQLGGMMKRRGLKVCVVGAKYDRSFWERYVRPGVVEDNQEWEDRIGEFEIGETFAFLQRAKCFIGYQCGLGIVNHYLGGKGAMWWRPDGNSGHPKRKLSFDEKMKDGWIRPGYEKNWLGLVYKRETPAQIMAEIDKRGWCE